MRVLWPARRLSLLAVFLASLCLLGGLLAGVALGDSGQSSEPSSNSPTVLDEVRTLQLMRAVPTQAAEVFRRVESNARRDLTVRYAKGYRHTWKLYDTPYAMRVATFEVIMNVPGKLLLAGDRRGTQPWQVDDCLLFEAFDARGRLLDRARVGTPQVSLSAGKVIPELPSPEQVDWHTHKACVVDISPLIPLHTPVTLRVSALDNGGEGDVSDVFLIYRRTYR